MFKQSNLFGDKLPLPKGPKELREVCCESCFNATEEKCDCRCKGAYHGLGRLNKREAGQKIGQNGEVDKW